MPLPSSGFSVYFRGDAGLIETCWTDCSQDVLYLFDDFLLFLHIDILTNRISKSVNAS